MERLGTSVETDANPAKQLAWAIFGRTPIVYGHGPMAAVAHRWKTQLNENAKAWAAWEPMPEANHNAIEGSLNPRELGDASTSSRSATPTSRARSPSAIAWWRSCWASERRAARRCGRRARRRWPACCRGSPTAISSASTSQSSTRPTPRRLHCWRCSRSGSPGPPDATRRAPGVGRRGDRRHGGIRDVQSSMIGKVEKAMRYAHEPDRVRLAAVPRELCRRQRYPYRHSRRRTVALRLPPLRIGRWLHAHAGHAEDARPDAHRRRARDHALWPRRRP